MTADSLFGVLAKYLTGVVAFITSHKLIASVAIVIALGSGFFFLQNTEQAGYVVTVEPKQFVQEVSLSGKVEAAQEVRMSFENSGSVARVYVAVGSLVEAGDPLVSLSSGTLAAELRAAEAQVISRKNERENGYVGLNEVVRQEKTKVASARTDLFSTSLEALPQSDTYDVEAPRITGLYGREEEGTYKFQVRRSGSTDTYELQTFDHEATEAVRVSETGPTRLGSGGLFVTFPEDLSEYRDTTWYVQIPNQKSSSYASLYSAYEEAKSAQDLAVENAQAELVLRTEGITIADAALAGAEAEVARLHAELEKKTLRAPFSGTVTEVDVEEGDTVTANAPMVSLMSVDQLEIESFVPEINISYLELGDPAVITLDAYGEYEPFAARVIAIDPAETLRDGVSTYRAQLAFDVPDERIRPGMTANIVITTDAREGVLSIPVGALERRGRETFVMVKQDGKLIERSVVAGKISSLGEIEIISGLSPGDEVSVAR